MAIGRGLRRAGHSVRVVTRAPFEGFVRGSGLDFAPLGADPGVLVASMTDNGVHARHRVWLPRPIVGARDFIRAGNGMVRAVLEAAAIEAAVTDVGVVARAKALRGRIGAEAGVGAAVAAVETALASSRHGPALGEAI